MKKIYLLFVFCCLSFTDFATTYYSAPAGGDPSVTTSWWDSPTGTGAHPSNFLNPADVFTVQSNMLMAASTWTVFGAVIMNSGYIWNNRTGGGGGGGSITLNFRGSLTMNGNSSISSNTGGGGIGGGAVNVNLYSDLVMTGTAFFNNPPSFTTVSFVNTSSTFSSPQHLSGTGSQVNSDWTFWNVSSGVFVQLVDNFNTQIFNTGSGADNSFNVNRNGTLDCQGFNFNGPGNVTISSGGTLYTSNTAGINGSVLCTGASSFSGAANYIFNGTSAQVTGTMLPSTINTSGGGGGGGGGGTSVGTVTVDNSAGVSLSQSTTFVNGSGFGGGGNPSLTLMSGTLTLGASNLVMGSSCNINGVFSNTSMIVTNGTGTLGKQFSTSGSFTYPVGDNASNYTPMTLNVTVSGFGGGTGTASVGVTNSKDPNNANVADYLNRYWTIGFTGFSATSSYAVTSAQYLPGDVSGTETNIVAAKWPSALPWVKFGAANTVSHVLTSIAITNTHIDFSGISNQLPTVTSTPNATICAGTPTVLAAITSTRDAPFTYTWAPSTGLSATTGASVTASPTVTTTYTVTMHDGNGFTATSTTKFTTDPSPGPITGAGSGFICLGQVFNLADAVTGGVWASSNSSQASIDASGNVTAVAPGSPNIFYTLPGGCFSTVTMFVVSSAPPISGTPQVCEGLTTALSEAITGGTWASSDNSLATVDGTGLVSGISAGDPMITFTLAPGCIATSTVTVNPLPAAISGATNFCIGGFGTVTDVTAGGTWSSSNISQAVVSPSSGIVTGTGAGSPDIIYTLSTGCTATYTVNVVAPPPAITGILSICAGYSTTLSDSLTGGTWSSGNPALAVVDPVTGRATGVSAGTPTIFYSVVAGCATAVPLVVNPSGVPAVTVAASPTGTVCPGTEVTLSTTSTAFAGASPTYKWIKNGYLIATGPSVTFIPMDGDVVYSILHSSLTCRTTDSALSNHIALSTVPVSIPVVTIGGSATVGKGEDDTLTATVSGGTPSPSYQWYKNNILIPGATSSFYIVTENETGAPSYNCVVHSGDACGTVGISRALVITVSDVSVKQIVSGNGDLKLAPNPNKGTFTVEVSSGYNEPVLVEITNILGEKVKQITTATNTATEVKLNAATGIYFLSASTDHGKYVARVVIN